MTRFPGWGGFITLSPALIRHDLAKVLLNTLSLLSPTREVLVWKLFLPNHLQKVVNDSFGYRTGRLEAVSIEWDEKSLVEFLQQRLGWASQNQFQDLDQLAEQDLLQEIETTSTKLGRMAEQNILLDPNTPKQSIISRVIAHLALKNKRLGPPHALLKLGIRLFQYSERERLSLEDWDDFLKQNDLDPDYAPETQRRYASFIMAIKGEDGETVGTSFLISNGSYAITCAHVVKNLGKTRGNEVILEHFDYKIGELRAEVYWLQDTGDKPDVNWTVLEDIAILKVSSPPLLELDELPLEALESYDGKVGCWCFAYLRSKRSRGDWLREISCESHIAQGFVKLSQSGRIRVEQGASGAPLCCGDQIIGMVQAMSGKESAYLIPAPSIQDVILSLTGEKTPEQGEEV